MKKLLVILLLTLSSSLFTFCKAQQEPGQIVISVGVGYSPGFNGNISITSQEYPAELSNDWDDNFNFKCSSIIPNIGVTIDYGVFKKFSVGLASSYQSEIVNWDLDYPPYFSDKIIRVNMAARLLFHLNKKNPHFDPYIGIRPGYCYWHDEPLNSEALNYYNSNGTPNYNQRFSNFLSNSNYFIFCFQVLYGMRFYTSDNLAFHFEVGIGQPFLVECGLTFRINTRKSTAQSSPQQTSKGAK